MVRSDVDGEAAADERVLQYPLPGAGPLDPPGEWARLRQGCPVAPVELPSGDRAQLLTRYDDVKQVLADPRFPRVGAGQGARIASDSGGVFNSDMASAVPQTGPEHQQWRRLVGRWFTAKRMVALRPAIEAMAESLIDDMQAHGQPADLKASLGFPLPVWVICTMLGVPDRDRDKFSYWSDTLLNLTRYRQEEIVAAQAEFLAYMGEHVRTKRERPGDDLLSELVTATTADGGRLTDAQLVGTGQGLLVAGHETTANMISKMVAMLLADRRRRWEQLLAEPALVRTAVEESLRFDANPGIGMPRYLAEDLELSDATLPAGTTVMCSMGAANRDMRAFDDAEEMDLSRSPNPHLSFGSGPHSCLGQALARTELQVTLEVLLRRLPGLDLAVPVEELQRVEGLVVGGLRELPVRW